MAPYTIIPGVGQINSGISCSPRIHCTCKWSPLAWRQNRSYQWIQSTIQSPIARPYGQRHTYASNKQMIPNSPWYWYLLSHTSSDLCCGCQAMSATAGLTTTYIRLSPHWTLLNHARLSKAQTQCTDVLLHYSQND